jgi:hypothetical protein
VDGIPPLWDTAVHSIRAGGPLPGRPGQRAATATLGKALLRAEPRTGTLLWIRDPFFTWAKGRRYLLALPAPGRPGAVTSLCLATYALRANLQTFIARQLLLLDREGRVLAAARPRDADMARQVWPPELFTPLRAVGIGLTEERFADARALNRAHPGANPRWWARTDPWRAVLGIALGVIIVAVIAAVVRLA